MSSDDLGHMLSVTHDQALEFFVVGLREVVPKKVPDNDLRYPASILAHYSQVSCESSEDVPAPRGLVNVFDNFIDPRKTSNSFVYRDHSLCEIAGAHCLFLTGFFKEGAGRHSVRWFTSQGKTFFGIASELTENKEKQKLLLQMARRFSMWSKAYSRLNRELRDKPYLIKNL